MGAEYILAIDQGTTSTRAIVFGVDGWAVTQASRELPQIFPRDGWVEQDAKRIWADTLAVCSSAMRKARVKASDILGCGITNQRETTVLWDRKTGKPVYNAIVWQDRRTAAQCRVWREQWGEQWLAARCGLVWDPYFSGGKLNWLLEEVPGARERAQRGELAFGTIDSFLLWHLTDGQVHATDATNASRTLLYNIHTQDWDDDLLTVFGVPRACLPQVLDSSAEFGRIHARHLGSEITVGGVAGDQHAAMVGQACFRPGMIKSTYGTGCFALLNTGETARLSSNRLLTTMAYRLAGKPSYALEGSIFSAGSTIKWLRDGLKVLKKADQSGAMAAEATAEGIYLVPAFTGLGAPYWDPDARAAILGLGPDAGPADIVRAALESVCFQTRDLLRAMADDATPARELRVDGGMVVNDWLMQRLADLAQMPVARASTVETTALGAALLAGLQAGVYADLDEMAGVWEAQRWFRPAMGKGESDQRYRGWQTAVSRILTS